MSFFPRMSFLKFFSLFVAAVFLLIGMTGCVKDVDFDQTNQISIQPEVQIDLVFFNLEKEDFITTENGPYRQVFRDTVRLEFLDDDFMREDLQEMELSFRYLNSFPQAFQSKIQFLSESNQNQYEVLFEIAPGKPGSPSRTEIIEHFEDEELEFFRRSIKLVFELEVQEEPSEGKLNLGAKGLFIFEF